MTRRHRRLQVGILATALLVGCGGSRESSFRSATRLIAAEPTEIFRPDSLVEPESVFEWSFEAPSDLASWRTQKNLRVHQLSGGGLRLSLPDRGTILTRSVDFEAAEIDALQLDVLPLRPGTIILSWAASDQNYSKERELQISSRSREAEFSSRTLNLRNHPEWRGTINKLRFQLGRDRFALRAIRGVRARYGAETMSLAMSRPWKVRFGTEVRTAQLALPGQTMEWPVDLVADSRLRVAYGVETTAPVAFGFRVTARDESSAPRQLFSRTLGAEEARTAGWQEATIDLEGLEGGWTLDFETFVEGRDYEPSLGVPAWGHPEILSPTDEPAPPNILLVSLDTLRADHLASYGYGRETTPNLDAWATRSAAQFDNVIAPTPSTLLSHSAMLTGLWSPRIGIDRDGKIPPQAVLLAERLHAEGYSTAAATGGGWMHPHYGFARGFDVLRYWSDTTGPHGELEHGIEHIDSWLASAPERPFFMFLHTYEIHSPYAPRQPYLERFGGPAAEGGSTRSVTYPSIQDRRRTTRVARPARTGNGEPAEEISDEELIAYYDAGIAYTDSLLARILRTLDERGLDENTIVVVTSDHGESLGERGLVGHGLLYDSNLKVPLLISVPETTGGGEQLTEQISLVDLVPSLLELAGLPVPSGLDGTSFAGLLDGSGDFRRREVWAYSPVVGMGLRIDNRFKYIYRSSVLREGVGGEEFYDLQQDPQEMQNLSSTSPDVARLRQRVRTFLSETHQGVRIRFENTSDSTFTGTLEGDLLFPGVAITSPDMACACLRRLRAGHATLEVPAGASYTVFFGARSARRARLAGRLDVGSPLDETLSLEGLEEPWSRIWDGRRWRTDDPADESIASLFRATIWWEGDRSSDEDEDEAPDTELIERLRALGYLD